MRNFGFTTIGPESHEQRLNATRLKVGQDLIRVRFGRWSNDEAGLHRYRVVRITKTRLIVSAVKDDGELSTIQHRLLLTTKSWNSKNDGQVTGREEGQANSYSESWNLATTDDEALEDLRERAVKTKVKRAATAAAEGFAKNPTAANATALRRALTAFEDTL